jgi:hypothetical protein
VKPRISALLPLVAVVAALAACAQPGGESTGAEPSPTTTASTAAPSANPPAAPATSAPPMSDTVPPTLGPGKAGERTPSDYIAGDTIAGRVTKGGSGPCYEVTNDDGKRYALHSTAGLTLQEGTYVTAKVAPMLLKIYCGPGEPYSLVSFTKQ